MSITFGKASGVLLWVVEEEGDSQWLLVNMSQRIEAFWDKFVAV
jgi:hypothetical protein